MTYEYYSSLSLVSSVVVYALAMFAHAAEWAAARRVDSSTEPVEAVSAELGEAAVFDKLRPREP